MARPLTICLLRICTIHRPYRDLATDESQSLEKKCLIPGADCHLTQHTDRDDGIRLSLPGPPC
jgi:hypothetical protein